MNRSQRRMLLLCIGVLLAFPGCCESGLEALDDLAYFRGEFPGDEHMRELGCYHAYRRQRRYHCVIQPETELTCSEVVAGLVSTFHSPKPEVPLSFRRVDGTVLCEGVFDTKGERLRDLASPTKI